MLVSQVSRIRISNVKGISRRFLSSSRNHLSIRTEEKSSSKVLRCLCFRLGPIKHSSHNVNSYRTLSSDISGRDSSFEFEAENSSDVFRRDSSFEFEEEDNVDISRRDSSFESKARNASQSFYNEHPDVINRSNEEIKEYRKAKGIIVQGENVPKPITKFSELILPANLQKVLMEQNYEEPTPIQSQGWPVAFSGRDMVGVSQTGSGKTLAYMLPAIIHASNSNSKRNMQGMAPAPNVLVLGPTRELVQQIHEVSKRFLYARRMNGACVYGGASKVPQLHSLQKSEICIATPGRLLDYLQNREVTLNNCTYLVLDEADRMLDMGFEPQIRGIVEQIPNVRQTLMWSATWPIEIRTLAEDFLRDYIHITVGNTELVANPNIQQNVYVVREDEKFNKLCSLLSNIIENEQCKVLVFAETKRKVDFLTKLLTERRVKAWGIHGDCSQYKRDRVINDFRRTTPSVLIATDIASRGLDISNIHHVINYDFPTNIEDYIHRIGRTARGSAHGESHSFFKPENAGLVKDLVSVLRESKQEINPELLSLAKANVTSFNKPQRRYNNNYSNQNYGRNNYSNQNYGRNRMYNRQYFV